MNQILELLDPAVIKFARQELGSLDLLQWGSFFWVFALGICLMRLWLGKFTKLELFSLAFPMGMMIMGLILFCCFTIGLPYNFSYLILYSSFVILVPALYSYFRGSGRDIFLKIKRKPKINFLSQIISFKTINGVWILAFIGLLYVHVVILLKAVFWPESDWDAVTTFDFYGRTLYMEGQFANSLILNQSVGTGVAYPPLTHLMIAFMYIIKAASPRILFPFLFSSMCIFFYTQLKYFTNSTLAIIIVLFFSITPELLAFVAFTKTNILQMVFVGIGTFSFLRWIHQKDDKKFLVLACMAIAMNAWTRSEGIEFVASIGAVLLFFAIKKQLTWKHFFACGLILFLPFFTWQVYLKMNHNLFDYFVDVAVIPSLFFDGEKLLAISGKFLEHLRSTQQFGCLPYILLLGSILNIAFYKKLDDYKIVLFFVLISSMCAHLVILYQIDYKGVSMSWLLTHSLKRYIFNFVPLIWFLFGLSFPLKWITDFYEQGIILKKYK